ncbi:hypothetical protein OG874_03035 [Nocardia sp. NBC_00565]|uniref:hypothetical protein n=1 Tax=Nocardia sp. NBC_00565 TaxID=2975993 RepID=UPI002E80D410|nr:hypothetical protein [Nocardia sp. NBC_00565]WUC04200.1 hypothetical protein OG874_03035 [Nocardia sp. NBC_00565]
MAINYVKQPKAVQQQPPPETEQLGISEHRDLPEPPPGSVIRFRVDNYLFSAVHIRDSDPAYRWYTTATRDDDQTGDWGVRQIDSWKRICDAATGDIEIATAWQVAKDDPMDT